MNGILVIDKPKDFTSRDVVNVISKKFQTKKVGHTGTLDPLATGVLVVCVGSYTKLVSILTNHQKEYIVTIKFGISTDTLDITGDVLEKNNLYPTKEKLKESLNKFLGPQKQEVPIYSAKKVNGKKLYEYARNKEEVELPVQDIDIYEIELLAYSKEEARIRLVVSKGTYIRSFVRDVCKFLGVLGTMKDLQRTRLGNFLISDSITLEEIENNDFKLLDFKNFLDFEIYQCNELEKNRVLHGNELPLKGKKFILLIFEDEELALYQKTNNGYKPLVMFDKKD